MTADDFNRRLELDPSFRTGRETFADHSTFEYFVQFHILTRGHIQTDHLAFIRHFEFHALHLDGFDLDFDEGIVWQWANHQVVIDVDLAFI